MIKIIWILESIGVMGVGLTMEDTLLKIVVFLCGLISLIVSITFGGLLKHLHQHNKTFEEFRTKNECNTMHEASIEVSNAKLEAIHTCVKTLIKATTGKDEGGNKSQQPNSGS